MSATFRKGKWKGAQGGSKEEWVILELAAMSSISYLDIGNLGAAFIEVKVGRDQLGSWQPCLASATWTLATWEQLSSRLR